MTQPAIIVGPPPPPPGSAVSQEGLRAQARQLYRQSLDAELPLTGRALGDMFNRSDRWGRERIQEVRNELSITTRTTAVPDAGTPAPLLPETGKPVVEPPVPTGHPPTPVPATITTPASAEQAHHHVGTEQPAGARAVVWCAFLLGIAASLAANVAHAHPGMGPRLAAGFVPLALLLAVECMTRPHWRRDGWLWGLARYGGTGLVAVVAAVMSYRHMHGLLLAYGEDPLTAALGPLAVDGLMIVSGFALLATAPAAEGGSR